MISKSGAPSRIYINCDGVKSADQEALKGKIQYFPKDQGVPIGYFPHRAMYVCFDSRYYCSENGAIQFSWPPYGKSNQTTNLNWFINKNLGQFSEFEFYT